MATTNKNRVEFGLSNVHIAVEDGAGGWSKPKKIPGAVLFSPKAEGEDFHFYADDGDYYNESTDNGYSAELSIALLVFRRSVRIQKAKRRRNSRDKKCT